MRIRIGLLAAAGLLAGAAAALAQDDRPVEVVAGYQAYRNFNAAMRGWSVQLTVPRGWRWDIVVEASASRGHDSDWAEYTYRDVAGLAGVRYTWQQTRRIAPFWQVLGGAMNLASSGQSCDPVGRCTADDTSLLRAIIQPGGGVTVMLTPRFGIRAQADLPIVLQPGLVAGFPRALAAAVVRLPD